MRDIYRGCEQFIKEKGMALPLFIIWSREYETGISILDEQHRGLVGIINSFYFHREDASGDLSKALIPTAEMFKAYVKINFLTIEKLMEVSEYPEIDKYRALHKKILNHIIIMDSQYRNERDAHGLLCFLKRYWLKTVHYNRKQYLPHLLKYYD